MSHEKRISTRIGRLTPVFVAESMPNDTFFVSTEVYVKLAPMLAPIYHRLNMYVHFFFIPHRLLWKDWEPFITGGRLGGEVVAPPVPPTSLIATITGIGGDLLDSGSVADYLGVPPIPDSSAATWTVQQALDLMPWAAWYKVWYDYYRDRNFVDDNTSLPLNSGIVGDTTLITRLLDKRLRCWQHEYFTSALPWTQRGAEVLMPLEGTGSIVDGQTGNVRNSADGSLASTGDLHSTLGLESVVGDGQNVYHDVVGGVVLDSSTVTINDFRMAMRLQEWLERNALAGSRYNESIMAHFGRKTSDGRLQRAEYLGGGKAVIQVNEVMTTAYSEDADAEVVPPGNMAGRGSAYSNINKFKYNCEEHGFVIGILSVMPSSGYMQGIPRMFQARNTFLDYPWPTFAHLGEQEVYDYEIYADPTSLVKYSDRADAPLFGYQSRYSDWKSIASSCHGDFRNTLDFWHLTRKFSAQPVLGSDFVSFEDELQDRIFAVSGVDTLWMYVYNKVSVKRSLPYFGTPML